MKIQIAPPQLSYDKRFMFYVNAEASGNVKAAAKVMMPLRECACMPDQLTHNLLTDLDLGTAAKLFPYTHVRLQPVLANQTLVAENLHNRLYVLFARLNLRRDDLPTRELGVYAYVDFSMLLSRSLIRRSCCFNCAAVDMLESTYSFEEAP